jgi:CheY-like chemotaxis protein
MVFTQRVLDQMRDYQFPWGSQTVSAGMASYEEGMGSHELLLAASDRALYQAKNGGRDMVCVAPKDPRPSVKTARRGKGSTRSAAPAAAPAPDVPPAPSPAPASKILYIVDDDAAVRSVIKRMLVGRGYDVWDTGDPIAAIAQIENAPRASRPDLILSDVIMPQMTGPRMIDRITQIIPGVRVIFMSGYVQSEISWSGSAGADVTFLAKPINMASLLAAVDHAMLQSDKAATESKTPQ